LFCEKCNRLADGVCPVCGNKKLREVQGDDFCYFTTVTEWQVKYFEETLKSNGIPVASQGEGVSVWTRLSTHYKVFVPYECFEKTREIYRILFGQQE